MEKSSLSIEQLQALHRSGHIEAAKKGFLALLDQTPGNAEALHALGLIAVEENKLSLAVDYLKEAFRYQADNPTLALHLANVIKMQGSLEKAKAILEKTVIEYPDYTPALNNLGTLHYALKDYKAAIQCYQQAIAKDPQYIDAYYNLGLALIKTRQLDEAERSFQKILDNDVHHSAARFQLACILMQQEQWDQAIRHFLVLENTHPQHLETESNLATCYLKKAAFSEAKIHYLKALDLSPQDTQILFNLGYITTQLGQIDDAIQYYKQILALEPSNFSAHYNLGSLYISERQSSLALEHFQEALKLQPDNATIDHLIKILKSDPHLSASPPAYLKSLFDYYAGHYDTHLSKVLNYQVPSVLFHALESAACLSHKKNTILDLGCGTGLCGEVFKPLAVKLVGVDLSPEMLKKAAEKNIYNELIEADILHFLQDKNACYDLIIAGDTLVYMGDLSPVFKLVKKALRPNGIFVFNTEISEDKTFAIHTTGRFVHQKNYLDHLMTNNHFIIRFYETALTRLQNNQALYGHIYVAQKS